MTRLTASRWGDGFTIPAAVRAMVFAVGETLVDETRSWSALADEAGVTRLALFAALGALIERGEDHRGVWDLLSVERPASSDEIAEAAFHPDALPCLQAGVPLGTPWAWQGTSRRRPRPPWAGSACRSTSSHPPRDGESRCCDGRHHSPSYLKEARPDSRWARLPPRWRPVRAAVGLLEQPCDVRLMGPRRLERHVRIGPSPAPETVEELQRGYS